MAAGEPGDRRRAAMLLIQLRHRSGRLASALSLAHDALPLLRAGGPVGDLIDTLRILALLAADTDAFVQSLAWAQEAHRLAAEHADAVRLSLTTNALGGFFDRIGDPWQGVRLMLESLELARACGDAYALTVALNNTTVALVSQYHLLRDGVALDEAREPLRRALPYVRELAALALDRGDPYARVIALGNEGEVLVHLGDPEAAAPLLDESIFQARRHGYGALSGRIGCSRGELALACGEPQLAWDRLQEVLTSDLPADPRATLRRLHHGLSRAAAALGRSADALHHLEAYLALERQRVVVQLRAQSELFVTRMEAEQMRRESQTLRERTRALEADVLRDPLTGLGNRRQLEAAWPALLAEAGSGEEMLSVAALDLDHFKRVNDSHGHAVGDQVLVALADLLRVHVRASDLAVRMGGEEFLLVLTAIGPERATEVCERLRQRVAEHGWASLAPGLTVTVSIGLASAPPLEAAALMRRADEALYRAKTEGRNRLVRG